MIGPVTVSEEECQCPLGLLPHFYQSIGGGYYTKAQVSMPSRASTSFLLTGEWSYVAAVVPCQCPHGLVPHFYSVYRDGNLSSNRLVSMPSRASTSFLRRQKYQKEVRTPLCQCPLGLVPHFYDY